MSRAFAVIPARGGSKRIPGKNIRSFSGQPIIHYSIKAAVESRLFARVIVSTDSEEIAAVAKKCGAEVPFLRPQELSDDHTPLVSVLRHSVEFFQKSGEEFDNFCCVLATAPFVDAEILKKAFDLFTASDAPSAIAVTRFSAPILRSFKITNQGKLVMNWPEYELTRSNDLEEAYHDAGQFYWINQKNFLRSNKVFMEGSIPVVLANNMVRDIDTEEDWKIAEMLFELNRGKGKKR